MYFRRKCRAKSFFNVFFIENGIFGQPNRTFPKCAERTATERTSSFLTYLQGPGAEHLPLATQIYIYIYIYGGGADLNASVNLNEKEEGPKARQRGRWMRVAETGTSQKSRATVTRNKEVAEEGEAKVALQGGRAFE